MGKDKNQRFSWSPSKPFSGNKVDFSINNPFYDRMLSLSKSCRNWQMAFFTMALFQAGTLSAYFYLANKTKLVPYVIEKEIFIIVVGWIRSLMWLMILLFLLC